MHTYTLYREGQALCITNVYTNTNLCQLDIIGPHASFPNIAPDIANNRFMKIRTFASFRRFWDVVMAGDLKLPAIL